MESGCSCILIPSGSVVLLQNRMLTKEKKKANTEQVVASVINSVHIKVNGCHYLAIIKVITAQLTQLKLHKQTREQGENS